MVMLNLILILCGLLIFLITLFDGMGFPHRQLRLRRETVLVAIILKTEKQLAEHNIPSPAKLLVKALRKRKIRAKALTTSGEHATADNLRSVIEKTKARFIVFPTYVTEGDERIYSYGTVTLYDHKHRRDRMTDLDLVITRIELALVYGYEEGR